MPGWLRRDGAGALARESLPICTAVRMKGIRGRRYVHQPTEPAQDLRAILGNVRAPEGRHSLAQGVSPGLRREIRASPVGTAYDRQRTLGYVDGFTGDEEEGQTQKNRG